MKSMNERKTVNNQPFKMNFSNELNRHRVAFVNNLIVEPLLPHLRQSDMITNNMAELCLANPTTSGKTEALLNLIVKRGPTAKEEFIKALVATHQVFLASLLDPTISETQVSEQPQVRLPSRETTFGALLNALTALAPLEKETERSGKTLLTSVNVFVEERPKSELGFNEIPFLFALKSTAFGELEAVAAWQGAPSKFQLEKQSKIYDAEIAEMQRVLSVLENGGIDFSIRIEDERIFKLISRLNKQFVSCQNGEIRLTLPVVKRECFSLNDSNVIACILHLMCFDASAFILRKTQAPKPNSYLVFGAAFLAWNSPVVMERDRQWVCDAVKSDESVFVAKPMRTNCPW